MGQMPITFIDMSRQTRDELVSKRDALMGWEVQAGGRFRFYGFPVRIRSDVPDNEVFLIGPDGQCNKIIDLERECIAEILLRRDKYYVQQETQNSSGTSTPATHAQAV